MQIENSFVFNPEQAIAILELFHHEDVTNEISQEIENDLTPEDKAAQEKAKTKRPPLDFYEMGLKEGDVLVYKHDESIICSIKDNRHIMFNGEICSISPITATLLGYSRKYVQPTPHWIVKETGRLLSDIYDETYPMAENM